MKVVFDGGDLIRFDGNKSILYIMIGLPGSGKSHISNSIKDYYGDGVANVLSSDNYRLKLFGDENDQTHNQEVFNALYKDMRTLLFNKGVVIFDATNCTIKDRQRVLNQISNKDIRENTIVVAYLVNTPYHVCVERDSNRDRVVGKEVIKKFLHKFQCPQYFEGFDRIMFNYLGEDLNINEVESFIVNNFMKDFDQMNPHHIKTLDRHCIDIANHYNKEDDFRYIAGMLHDVGKVDTQTFDEQGIAHYYSHDSVGAYKMCCFNEYIKKDHLLETIMFINYHMNFHRDWRNEKYRKLFGDDLYNMLVEFANYDMIESGTNEIHSDIIRMQKEEKLMLSDILNSNVYREHKNHKLSK